MKGRSTAAPKVVIVGGGFGGLNAAKALAESRAEVLLIDRRNHHLFQPLLYQVATAGLNPADIAYPIRSVLAGQDNAQVLLGEVTRVDLAAKRVHLGTDAVEYDYLVLAAGASVSYFGQESWRAHAPGLKSVEDALEIRRRLLWAFEMAEKEECAERRRGWMTFAIIGGGPTGVELAGALAEIASRTLTGNFRRIDPSEARILLIEGRNRILPGYSETSSARAERQLVELGVELVVDSKVSHIDAEGIRIGESWVPCRTSLWAAGVRGAPLGATLGVPLDAQGRVRVREDLSIPGHPEAFVVGDLAHLPWKEGALPGVAPAAVQGARYVAAIIARELAGKRGRRAFEYRDKGALATVGRAAAVANLGRLELSGFVAWMLWWIVHIYYLIGFRSRLMVMLGWAWSYLSFRRGVRLITEGRRGSDGDLGSGSARELAS